MVQSQKTDTRENAEVSGSSLWESENWGRLQELFHLAETAPPGERTRVLNDACSDSRLVDRVLELLISAPAEPVASATLSETVPLGTRVGPYALLRHLGTGGLGSVYLAERMVGGALQKCALKVLSMHAAGPQFESRFQREQQILARLNHPHITRLLDAGFSDTNQPYLIMEYVNGVDVVSHCDENRLGVSARLQVFLQICDAVAYAHRNLTVHLDLKPSNVLVSTDGEVKLLDFGTSKLIDPDSASTTTVMATPAYAAPEQLRNEPVTTACDIYSLGAMLFELLAGKRPNGASSAARLFERAMTEAEPEALTKAVSDEAAASRGTSAHRLRQTLSGDLETILNKCLRPRPRDRYPSVDALREDLERYLNGQPVLARPQTFAYRFGKFVRRNRVTVFSSAFVLMLMASVVAYAGWRQQQAVRQGRRAEQMQTFLYRLLYVANTNYTGKPSLSVPDFLELGARLVSNYVTNPADLRRAQLGLAESMFENDDTDGAAKVFDEVVRSARSANDFNSEAEAEAPGGYIAYEKGNVSLGKSMTAHALELSHRRGATTGVRVWSAVYYAMVRDESGLRTDANLHLMEGAVNNAVGQLPSREVADAYYNLALAYQFRDRYTDSEAAYRQALRTYEQESESQCDQADVHRGIAKDEENLGRSSESLSLYEEAWAESKKCSGPESQKSLGNETYVAEGLLRVGRSAEALAMMQQALSAFQKLGIDGPRLNRPLRLLGEAYVEQRNFAAAETLLRKVVSGGGTYADLEQEPEFDLLQLVWAKALLGEGRRVEALAHAKEAQRLLLAKVDTPAERQSAAQATTLVTDLSRK